MVIISPKVKMSMQITRPRIVCANALSAKPVAHKKYPAAMTRRAGNFRVSRVNGSSQKTMSAPFSETMAP